MIRILRFAWVLLACIPAAIGAQDDHPSCDDARTQMDMNRCAALAYARADTALNQTYQQVLEGIEPTRKETLREAQRAWTRMRDADCELENAEFEGGSIHPMLFALCQAHATRVRTGQLRQLLASDAEDGGGEHGAILRATATRSSRR